ncbi:hypothetical protein SPHINGOT1_200015 [Sphingomonas sp. T1]|nr:hypothetical protein SPHINGOT1_200015 [Sphingomonas sp. T1]
MKFQQALNGAARQNSHEGSGAHLLDAYNMFGLMFADEVYRMIVDIQKTRLYYLIKTREARYLYNYIALLNAT